MGMEQHQHQQTGEEQVGLLTPEQEAIRELENQSCFVLHPGPVKGAVSSGRVGKLKSDGVKKAGKNGKTGKRPEPSGSDNSLPGFPSCIGEPPIYGQLRMKAFETIWARLEKFVENTLEERNQGTFENIEEWICQRQFSEAQLDLYKSAKAQVKGTDSQSEPSSKGAGSAMKQLQTALLMLGGVDPSDHQKTFDGLTAHLKAHKCHVARLTTLEFSTKSGIGGVLRSLLRQFVKISLETTAMEIFAAWYQEEGSKGHAVVVIIENAEACEGQILVELIMLLSEWIALVPLVLIMGMTTTGYAIKKLLPARALTCLRLWKFQLQSPFELLQIIIKVALVDSVGPFNLGHKVAQFLYEYFLTHDLTVTSIMRSLRVKLEEQCASLPKELLKHAADLPSISRQHDNCDEDSSCLGKKMARVLWELKEHRRMWAMAFLCLDTVGQHLEFSFMELFCEALKPQLLQSSQSSRQGSVKVPEKRQGTDANNPVMEECPLIKQVLSRIREISIGSLKLILEDWRKLTMKSKLNEEVCAMISNLAPGPKDKAVGVAAGAIQASKESQMGIACGVQSITTSSGYLLKDPGDNRTSSAVNESVSVSLMSRSTLRRLGSHQVVGDRKLNSVSQKEAEDFLRRILGTYLIGPESLPFHEIFCFKDVTSIKQALIGEPRRVVHLDLMHSQEGLQCQCCPSNGLLTDSMHDASLAYILSQEHPDVINIHDWYQSFAKSCTSVPDDSRKKTKHAKKVKRAKIFEGPFGDNPSLQARFSRATMDLQVVGLLQAPKKGHPDSVRRLTYHW